MGKVECLRGCQYFNIEFLMNAGNKDKIVDLNQLVERCGTSKLTARMNEWMALSLKIKIKQTLTFLLLFYFSLSIACSEAYGDDKPKKEHCFRGCNEMMMLQAKAPLINGWLVYMGATDRNLVLLQPDFDIPLKEDWVRLDSMFRNDYDYDSQYGSNYDKISTQIETVPRYIGRDSFNCAIPVWMWLLPLCLLVAFLYIHYSNYIYSIFLNESLQQEFGLIDPNQVGCVGGTGRGGGSGGGGGGSVCGVPMNVNNGDDKKFMQSPREFAVGTDFYFYPSPAIPPPKYNDIAEAILIDSSDDENDNDTVNSPNVKPNDQSVKTNFDKDKSSLSVDI